MQAEQPEQYAELRATAELFPSAMQDSELGEIPEGWEATTFGEVSICLDKHRVPLSKRQREQKQGNIPYYGATSVMDYVDEHIFDGIYLLVGEDGSVLKEDGTPFVQYIWGKSWVNNHAHVIQGANGVSTEQLMCFISMQNIAAYVTGAVQLKLNQKNMNSIPFVKAPNEVNEKFSQIVGPFFAKYRALLDQSSTLSTLRDSLLPKLLSGELTLPGTEEPQTESQDAAHG
jgi:type I restriction enzyme S subunit